MSPPKYFNFAPSCVIFFNNLHLAVLSEVWLTQPLLTLQQIVHLKVLISKYLAIYSYIKRNAKQIVK